MDLSRPHLSPLWDYQHNNYQRADVRYRRITAAADAAGKAAQTAASASATTTAVASISSSTSARTAAVTTSTGRSGVPAGLATTTTTTTTASAASTVAPGIESRIAPIRSSFDVHVSGAFGHDGAYMNLADRAGNGLGDGGSRSNINSNSTGSTSASSSSSSSPCGPDNDNDNDGDGGDDDDDRDDDEDGRGASGDQDDKSSSRSQAGRRDGAADTAKTAKATPTGAGPTAAAAVGGGGGGASSGAATKTTKARRLKKAMPLLVNLTNCKYDIVRECVVNHGCKVVDDPTAWSLFWIDTGVSLERVLEMKAHQRINHFPGMHEICRKDHLARNLGRLSRLFPKDYNFFPKTWMLPSEWSEFKMSFKPSRKGGGGGSGSGSSSGQSFIAKPDHGCQGKGIFLFKDPDQVHDLRNSNMIIQTYLASPCLIDGFKFDLRVYVLVTSVDPLRVFIYRDGLARFATEKYHPPSDKNMGNVCMHLTNYAINKHSDKFVRDDDERGSKRTISSVLKQLVELGRIPSAEDTWRRISDVVVKTIVTVQPQISRGLKSWFPSATALQGLAQSQSQSQSAGDQQQQQQPFTPLNVPLSAQPGSTAESPPTAATAHPIPNIAIDGMGSLCFEILGFDIFLDAKMKPWVLEVNHSPSFTCDSPLDREIKAGVISDALRLLNLSAGLVKRLQRQEKAMSLTRLWRPGGDQGGAVAGEKAAAGGGGGKNSSGLAAAASDGPGTASSGVVGGGGPAATSGSAFGSASGSGSGSGSHAGNGQTRRPGFANTYGVAPSAPSGPANGTGNGMYGGLGRVSVPRRSVGQDKPPALPGRVSRGGSSVEPAGPAKFAGATADHVSRLRQQYNSGSASDSSDSDPSDSGRDHTPADAQQPRLGTSTSPRRRSKRRSSIAAAALRKPKITHASQIPKVHQVPQVPVPRSVSCDRRPRRARSVSSDSDCSCSSCSGESCSDQSCWRSSSRSSRTSRCSSQSHDSSSSSSSSSADRISRIAAKLRAMSAGPTAIRRDGRIIGEFGGGGSSSIESDGDAGRGRRHAVSGRYRSASAAAGDGANGHTRGRHRHRHRHHCAKCRQRRRDKKTAKNGDESSDVDNGQDEYIFAIDKSGLGTLPSTGRPGGKQAADGSGSSEDTATVSSSQKRAEAQQRALDAYHERYHPGLLAKLSDFEDTNMGSYQRIFPPPEPSTQQPASGAARSTTNTAHTHTSKLGYYLNLICETANWSSETNSTKARREFLAKKREKEAEKQRKFDDWKLRRQRSNPHVHAKISTTIDKSVLAMSRRAISMSDVHVRRRYELVYRVRGFSKSPYGLHGGGGGGAGGDAGHMGAFEAAMAPLAHPLLPPPPVSVPPGFWTTAQGGAHQQLQLQLALHQQQVLMAQQMQNSGSGSGGSGSGGGRSKQLMPIKVKNLNDSFKGGWEPHASSAGGASGGSGGGLASTANSMFATLVGANGTGSGSGGGSGGVGGGSGNGDVGVGVSFLGTSPFSGRGMTGSKGVPAALMRMAATTNAASGGDRGGDRGSNASSGGLRIPAGPPGPLGSLLLATMSNNGTGSGTGSSSNLYSGRSSLTTVGGSGNGASGKLGSSGSSSKAGDGSSARLSSSTYASSGSSAASWSAALPSDLMSATVRRTPRARMQTSATDSIMASSSSPSARMMQYDRPAAAGRPSQSQSQSQSQGAAPIGGKQASRVRPASTGSGGMRHAYRTGKSDAAVTSAFPINISPGHGHGRTAGHAAGAGHLPASKQMFWRVPDLDRGERVDK